MRACMRLYMCVCGGEPLTEDGGVEEVREGLHKFTIGHASAPQAQSKRSSLENSLYRKQIL